MYQPEYQEFLDSLGARWASEGEKKWIESYGDVGAEYAAVVEGGLGLIDRSDRETLVISGDDAIPWLQGLVTSDLFDLAEEGSGQRSSAVNQNGRFIADARLLHIPEMLLVDLERGQAEPLLGHLKRHIIMEKVNVVDRSEQTARIGVYGAQAVEALEAVSELAHRLAGRKAYQGSWGQICGEDVIVMAVPWLGLPGFEIFCGAEGAHRIWQALRAYEGGSSPAAPFGNEAFEMLRVEAGVPRFGVELSEKVIPLEANLDHTISFTKGCYLGQEIIARLDTLGTPARLLRHLFIDADAVPAAGTKLLADGKNVGQIERAIRSPRMGGIVAMGFVKRDHNGVDNILDLESGGQIRLKALPSELHR